MILIQTWITVERGLTAAIPHESFFCGFDRRMSNCCEALLEGSGLELKFDIRRSLASQVARGWPLSDIEQTDSSEPSPSGFTPDASILTVSVITGAMVVPPLPLLVSPEGAVLGESLLYPAASISPVDLPPSLEVVVSRAMPGHRMLLCGQYSQYFWHWMTEFLPRVLVARAAGFDGLFVLQNDPPRFVLESLAMLGVAADQLVPLGTTAVAVEELWIPTPWTGTAGHGRVALEEHPRLIDELRGILIGASGVGTGPERVYIARASAPRGRNIRNEAELRELLQQFGFVAVVMEELPLDAQIRLMRGAKVVAGPHGAGMVHAMVMPRDATILEFLPDGFAPTTNHFLHRLYSQRYQSIVGRPLDDRQHVHPNLADIELDLKLVSEWLQNYCSG